MKTACLWKILLSILINQNLQKEPEISREGPWLLNCVKNVETIARWEIKVFEFRQNNLNDLLYFQIIFCKPNCRIARASIGWIWLNIPCSARIWKQMLEVMWWIRWCLILLSNISFLINPNQKKLQIQYVQKKPTKQWKKIV